MHLRHFDVLDEDRRVELFDIPPAPVGLDNLTGDLGVALGAVLYVPADRPNLVQDVRRRHGLGVQAIVVDLEDGVRTAARRDALSATASALSVLGAPGGSASERSAGAAGGTRPALFVRVPDPAVLLDLVARLDADAAVTLTGFALPKFEGGDAGDAWFAALDAAERSTGRRFFVMPIVEARTIAHRETRFEQLDSMRRLLDQHRSRVLTVRIGATDLSGAFGLRRDGESTIYDVRVVADAIADIVNVFGREDPWAYPVSGAVWEHFAKADRVQRPRLRATPFDDLEVAHYRRALLSKGIDALISEIELDKINGLVGKTIIHPSHVSIVHALSAVSHEEYCDAVAIAAARAGGGILRSEYGNKMNEVQPHSAWADRTITKAGAFGVLNPGVSYVDLLLALDRIAQC